MTALTSREAKEWMVQLRYPDSPTWFHAGGHFDHEPSADEARAVGYRAAGLRSKGSPLPVEVRVIAQVRTAGPAIPFREESH